MPVVHKWSTEKRVSLSAYSNNTDEIGVGVIVALNCSIFIEQFKLVNSREGGMRGQFLVKSTANFVEGNIYADKSSLILDWLLRVGIEKNGFLLREMAKDREVSIGLVQRVLESWYQRAFSRLKG